MGVQPTLMRPLKELPVQQTVCDVQLAPEPTPTTVRGLQFRPTWPVILPRLRPRSPRRLVTEDELASCTLLQQLMVPPLHWLSPESPRTSTGVAAARTAKEAAMTTARRGNIAKYCEL